MRQNLNVVVIACLLAFSGAIATFVVLTVKASAAPAEILICAIVAGLIAFLSLD